MVIAYLYIIVVVLVVLVVFLARSRGYTDNSVATRLEVKRAVAKATKQQEEMRTMQKTLVEKEHLYMLLTDEEREWLEKNYKLSKEKDRGEAE